MTQLKLTSLQTTYSVLPDNHSNLERALELSFLQALYSVDHPYPALLNAQSTSIEILPYLATEKQVKIWRDDDSEQVKRDLTETSWKVKRLSGTKAGIRCVLTALNFESEIVPWHQQVPQNEPYHLSVLAWAKDSESLNVANIEKLYAHIEEVKSERDTVELSLTYGVETAFALAGATSHAVTIKQHQIQAALWPEPIAIISPVISCALNPAINIQSVLSVAVIPTVYCYAEFFINAHACSSSITVSDINAQAQLG